MHSKGQPNNYEGAIGETYKCVRKKWYVLILLGSLLPFLIAIIVSYYHETLQFMDLLTNGEVLLSLFSLTVPMTIDLFYAKTRNDEGLTNAFILCFAMSILQLVLYCTTRMSFSADALVVMQASDEISPQPYDWKSVLRILVPSIIMIGLSWLCCENALRAMFAHGLIQSNLAKETKQEEMVMNDVGSG